MLNKFKLFITLTNSIIKLYKTNKSTFFLGLFLLVTTTYFNIDIIKEQINGKVDILQEYVEKSYIIESDLDIVRNSINCNEISVCLLHNGEQFLTRLHLIKFSLLYQSVDVPNNNKFIVYRYHLAPYVPYVRQMLNRGYFYVENVNNSKDPLIRALHLIHNIDTVIYIPLFKDNHIVAFAVASWNEEIHLTHRDIQDLIRLMDITESHL